MHLGNEYRFIGSPSLLREHLPYQCLFSVYWFAANCIRCTLLSMKRCHRRCLPPLPTNCFLAWWAAYGSITCRNMAHLLAQRWQLANIGNPCFISWCVLSSCVIFKFGVNLSLDFVFTFNIDAPIYEFVYFSPWHTTHYDGNVYSPLQSKHDRVG